MHNLSKENKIILLLAAPLFALSLLLAYLGQAVFVSNAAEAPDYNTDTIYERRVCADCNCQDDGKKLISFRGQDANCEDYANEEQRRLCYDRNSQMAFSCENLEDSGAVSDCYAQHSGPNFDYYHGAGGTLVATKSLAMNGSRLYLNGFDCRGEHKITTGTTGRSSEAMIIREGSRDVEYGGNLDVYGNVNMQSAQAGMYFGSEIEYEESDIGDGKIGRKLSGYDTSNGINLNKCDDMKVMANGRDSIVFPNKKREAYTGLEIPSGLEMNGPLKVTHLFLGGQRLIWTEPIRGNFVLYTTGGGAIGNRENHTFLWAPSTPAGPNAGMYLPAYFAPDCMVVVEGEIATYSSRQADGRLLYLLSKPGRTYGGDVEILVDCAGDRVYWDVPSGAVRYEETITLGAYGCDKGNYPRDGGDYGDGSQGNSPIFLWKPEADPNSSTPGKLVILLPSSYPSECKVTVNGHTESVYSRGNGNRPTYRFPETGSFYGTNVEVKASCPGEGNIWTVPDGSQRYETQ